MYYDIIQKTQLEWNLTKHVMGDSTRTRPVGNSQVLCQVYTCGSSCFNQKGMMCPEFGGSDAVLGWP